MFHLPRIPQRLRQNRFLIPAAQAALALLLTAAVLHGGYAPFSLAITAAAGAHLSGILCVLGSGVGAWLFLDFQPGLRHLASAILICCANTVFFDSRFSARPLFRPLLCAAVTALVQSVYLVGRSASAWAVFLVSLAAQVGASVLFPPLWDKRAAPQNRLHTWLLLSAALALALAQVRSSGGFTLGRAAMALPLLLCARVFSPVQCAAIGLCAGLSLDLSSAPYAPLCTAAMGCGCALAAALSRYRSISAAVYCAGIGVTALLFGDFSPTVYLWESVSGAAAFLLLPRTWLPTDCTAPAAVNAAPSPLKRQLEQASAAFRDLYDSFFRGTATPSTENPSVIFDRAAEQVCRKCVLRDHCWQQNYNATYNAFNDACPHLLRHGQATAQDFPSYFTSRCVHLTDFLTAVNGELRTFLLRRQYHQRLLETRRQAQEQYAQLGELLSTAATAVEALNPAVPLAYGIGSALRPKEGNNVCGDRLASFEVGATLYLLISDGMGSGESAHREAAMTVRLLQQFLVAGVEPTPALKTLNAALALRGEDGGGFTTIDLLALHRGSGSAELYKYGAAPSYLKRGDSVTRFTAASLPAGLQSGAQPPEYTRLMLSGGSFFVMVSDGIADENDDAWLQQLLRDWHGSDAEELSALILSESRKHKGLDDDCAVLVLSLSDGERGRKRQV